MRTKNAERRPLMLFPVRDGAPAPPDFETRLRDFARAAASRGRAAPADVARFVVTLGAYYETWKICSRTAVPPLDERARQLAVAAYCEARGSLKRPAA